MRSFIVLCLVAVACADKLGYNYQPVEHSDAGLSFTPGNAAAVGGGANNGGSVNFGAAINGGSIGGTAGFVSSNNDASIGGSGNFGAAISSGSIGSSGNFGSVNNGASGNFGSANNGPSGNFGSANNGASGSFGSINNGASIDSSDNFGSSIGSQDLSGGHESSAPSSSYTDSQGELEKEYYSFSANDDDFTDPAAASQLASSVKQGLRVIFIKGPENKGLENAALSLAKQAANQKTDIYVLNKQADIGDLANKLNTVNKNNNNRPEVHFVKYRTPEDAANAQKAIQDQYDSLGGPSQNINGGVAPVLNFASQAAIAGPAVSTPGNSYLPSSVLRRLRFRL